MIAAMTVLVAKFQNAQEMSTVMQAIAIVWHEPLLSHHHQIRWAIQTNWYFGCSRFSLESFPLYLGNYSSLVCANDSLSLSSHTLQETQFQGPTKLPFTCWNIQQQKQFSSFWTSNLPNYFTSILITRLTIGSTQWAQEWPISELKAYTSLS